jgi:hypothetical protein
MRTSLVASILIASGAARAAVSPDFQAPAESIVARVHAMAVEVVGSGDGKAVNVASGVLAGGGIVFTDLRAISAKSPDGAPVPPDQIAVLTAAGVLEARIAGVAPELDVAVLELPQAARGIEGPALAEGSLAAGDRLLAVRASNQGGALRFEAMGFSLAAAEGDGLLPTPTPPLAFAGAPVFDARGELAGLLVSPSEEEGLFVPAKSLLEILTRLRAAAAPAVPSAPAARPRWFTEGLAAWGSPRPPPQEGSYDEQYTTW